MSRAQRVALRGNLFVDMGFSICYSLSIANANTAGANTMTIKSAELTTAHKPVLFGLRSYEWMGHRITVQRAGSNNESALQHEPSCETCSLPYAIAEAVKFMNRFSLHTLSLNKEDAIHWLI